MVPETEYLKVLAGKFLEKEVVNEAARVKELATLKSCLPEHTLA